MAGLERRPPVTGVLALPRKAVGVMVLVAIAVMLTGVFLRYIAVRVTDYLDVDPINFFWVEEVGELLLAWLTLVGAAVGIEERSHFTLAILVHKLSAGAQRAIHVFNHALIAGFGAMIAWYGWGLVQINKSLVSPALEINLAWLYSATVVAGILMIPYALKAMAEPISADHTEADVRE
jgi:TRAP-type C4-dicarboxylate transport system permease small subunit